MISDLASLRLAPEFMNDNGGPVPPKSNMRRGLKEIFGHGAIALLSFGTLACVLKLWNMDLSVPFEYEWDATEKLRWVKSLLDNSWAYENQFLGAPGVQQLYDFPVCGLAAVPSAMIKLLSLFSSDAAVCTNLYYLATFPLIAVVSLAVFRNLEFEWDISFFCSLLFTFTPFHFLRGETHIFHASYLPVPLLILVSYWIYSRSDDLFRMTGPKPSGCSLRFLVSALVCTLTALFQYVFAVFGAFFMLLAGTASSLQTRRWRPVIISGVLALLMVVVILLLLTPIKSFTSEAGTNGLGTRNPAEAEVYGLKIVQLVLPVRDHRIPALDRFRKSYDAKAPCVNENGTASLGIVASIGLLLALVWTLSSCPAREAHREDQKRFVAFMVVGAILLSTTGGLASLMAFGVNPTMRTPNRISIFIAFLCILAVGIFLESIKIRLGTSIWKRGIFSIALIVLFIGGVLDQTSESWSIRANPSVSDEKRELFRSRYPWGEHTGYAWSYEEDREFVRQVESLLEQDALVFQLPYVPYPEMGMVNRMLDYEHFRPYLHSRSIKWSYGAVRNRWACVWQRQVSDMETESFLINIALQGFRGVYLNRHGYVDGGKKIENELTSFLGSPNVTNKDGSLLFWSLGSFKRASGPATESSSAVPNSVNLSIVVEWLSGFHSEERQGENVWRWSASRGELRIVNLLEKTLDVEISCLFQTGYPEKSRLRIEGQDFVDELQVSVERVPYRKVISMPPGPYKIVFESDAKRVNAPRDERTLVFAMIDPQVGLAKKKR